MNQAHLLLASLLAVLVAEQPADPIGPPPPVMTLDSIKAARDKFDLEMKQDTKRPWDGMDLTGPHALEKRQDEPADQN